MMLVEGIRWLLLLLGALMLIGSCAANWAVAIGYVTERKFGSMIPLVGGLGASFALVFSPITCLRNFWWIPLVLDPGCALWVTEHLLWVARKWFAHNRSR